MAVPFCFVNSDKGKVLCIYLQGKDVKISEDHIAFGEIINALKENLSENDLLELINEKVHVQNYLSRSGNGRAFVDNQGKVFVDGEEVHGSISKRITQFMQEGLPFEHLLKFLDKVSENPSYSSRQELFDFLEHEALPITEDGCFIAYKAIRSDWTDKHTGKINNNPGRTIKMKRSDVDDDRGNGCSKGLHIGALKYVYGYSNGTDKIITVKVDPKNVVSVPSDSNYEKCRTCEYEVLREFDGELHDNLYDKKGEQSFKKQVPWDYDDLDDDYNDVEDDYYEEGDVYEAEDVTSESKDDEEKGYFRFWR